MTLMTLPTDRIAAELLEEALLALEQVSTRVTLLAINATRKAQHWPPQERRPLHANLVLAVGTTPPVAQPKSVRSSFTSLRPERH